MSERVTTAMLDNAMEYLADAIEVARQESDAFVEGGYMYLETRMAILDALLAYDLDEPNEVGELGKVEGAFDDGSEVSWYCELTIGGLEGE